MLCYEELLAAEAGAEPGFRWVDVDENDACGLCYTSGTTGRPKVGLLRVAPSDAATVSMDLMHSSQCWKNGQDTLHAG